METAKSYKPPLPTQAQTLEQRMQLLSLEHQHRLEILAQRRRHDAARKRLREKEFPTEEKREKALADQRRRQEEKIEEMEYEFDKLRAVAAETFRKRNATERESILNTEKLTADQIAANKAAAIKLERGKKTKARLQRILRKGQDEFGLEGKELGEFVRDEYSRVNTEANAARAKKLEAQRKRDDAQDRRTAREKDTTEVNRERLRREAKKMGIPAEQFLAATKGGREQLRTAFQEANAERREKLRQMKKRHRLRRKWVNKMRSMQDRMFGLRFSRFLAAHYRFRNARKWLPGISSSFSALGTALLTANDPGAGLMGTIVGALAGTGIEKVVSPLIGKLGGLTAANALAIAAARLTIKAVEASEKMARQASRFSVEYRAAQAANLARGFAQDISVAGSVGWQAARTEMASGRLSRAGKRAGGEIFQWSEPLITTSKDMLAAVGNVFTVLSDIAQLLIPGNTAKNWDELMKHLREIHQEDLRMRDEARKRGQATDPNAPYIWFGHDVSKIKPAGVVW